MTVNELADAIQYCGDGGYNLDAAIALREQENKIKKLKALLKRSLPVSYIDDGFGNKHPVLCPDETLFDEIEEALGELSDKE